MAFDLSTIMDGLASASGVARAFGYPNPNITPPMVTVEYPTDLEYDLTAHANGTLGKVSATFTVRYWVGLVVDKSARDALNTLVNGAASLKVVLDGAVSGYDIVNTQNCLIEEKPSDGNNYLTARFDVVVVG